MCVGWGLFALPRKKAWDLRNAGHRSVHLPVSYGQPSRPACALLRLVECREYLHGRTSTNKLQIRLAPRGSSVLVVLVHVLVVELAVVVEEKLRGLQHLQLIPRIDPEKSLTSDFKFSFFSSSSSSGLMTLVCQLFLFLIADTLRDSRARCAI